MESDATEHIENCDAPGLSNLINSGLDANHTLPDCKSLLEYAVEKNCHSVTKLLFERGADIASKPYWQFPKVVPFWTMESPVDVFDGNSLLFLTAVEMGNTEIAVTIYQAKCAGLAKPKRQSLLNEVLFWAIRAQVSVILRFLLAEGADANTANKFGDTILMSASANGNFEAVKMLVGAGARVNELSKGNNALLDAIYYSHTDIALYLLEQGSSYDNSGYHGAKPLSMAKRRKLAPVVEKIKQLELRRSGG
jgi:ankyrin repeat protein